MIERDGPWARGVNAEMAALEREADGAHRHPFDCDDRRRRSLAAEPERLYVGDDVLIAPPESDWPMHGRIEATILTPTPYGPVRSFIVRYTHPVASWTLSFHRDWLTKSNEAEHE